MPLAAAIIPAVIGGATAVYSAGQQKKAASKANAAQQAAAAEQQRIQQENLARITTLNQPRIDVGNSALDAIAHRYGLTSAAPPAGPSTAPTAAPATSAAPPASVGNAYGAGSLASRDAPAPPSAPAPTGPDWNAYLQANPDVAQNAAQRIAAGEQVTPEQVAHDHYQSYGQQEGRTVSNLPPEAGPQQAPVDPNLVQPTYQTPTYDRPDQPVWQGGGEAPNAADYLDPSNFTTSPGYEFRLNEGNRNLNAKYGARGLLKSGGAIKGFDQYNQNTASAEYGNWYQQQLARLNSDRAQFNTDRSANYNIFSGERNNLNANFDSDRQVGLTQFNNDRSTGLTQFNNNRAYDANRADTATNNLFRLSDTGANAISTIGNAGTNAANANSNTVGNAADSTANTAYANGAANAGAIGAIGGAAANIFSRYAPAGNGSSPGNPFGTFSF